jgi:hypothetical protein
MKVLLIMVMLMGMLARMPNRRPNPFMELPSSPTNQTIGSIQVTYTGNSSGSGNGSGGAIDNGSAHGNARKDVQSPSSPPPLTRTRLVAVILSPVL